MWGALPTDMLQRSGDAVPQLPDVHLERHALAGVGRLWRGGEGRGQLGTELAAWETCSQVEIN